MAGPPRAQRPGALRPSGRRAMAPRRLEPWMDDCGLLLSSVSRVRDDHFHRRSMHDVASARGETSLRQRLKSETAAVHRRLEARLGLLDPDLDGPRYRRVLEAFYGFYVPLESELTRLTAASPPPEFSLRM